MSNKRKALGGNASDHEFGAFPYRIASLERENRALKRQVEKDKEKLAKECVSHPSCKYIIPDYYLPEHLGLNDDEVDDFKEFVKDWAMSGELNEIMEELRDTFRALREEENEEDEEDD